ncbi:MAG: carboxylating nicotinate-nucleotide diphosphorylase [Crocinitomicaceae bacterium]
MNLKIVDHVIKNALNEDIGPGDYSSLASVPKNAVGKAKLLVKDEGIIAGIDLAKRIMELYDPNLQMEIFIEDGSKVKPGDIAFTVEGSSISILSTERLMLNFMQRMSGIATLTNKYVQLIQGSKTKLLDTRKTTPGIRYMEKWAVRIGGGHNHRYALYDMIMLKDNHIDYAGGIQQAIEKTNQYLKENNLDLKIEIEVRDFDELNQVLKVGQVDRIMLDNFTPSQLKEALILINGQYETEASGGITEVTLKDYAATNVDYISVGALTHSFKSLDMSLKADFKK